MFIESAVPLAEVAKVIRKSETKTADECRELGLLIGEDWAGRHAVAVVDAHALASGQARASRTRDAAWRAHQNATEKWEQDRQHAYETAAAAAHISATRRGRGGPAVHTEATEAGVDAVRKFEKKNRMPTFQGTATTWSWFDDDREKVAAR
jgi:hypothetical protein